MSEFTQVTVVVLLRAPAICSDCHPPWSLEPLPDLDHEVIANSPDQCVGLGLTRSLVLKYWVSMGWLINK